MAKRPRSWIPNFFLCFVALIVLAYGPEGPLWKFPVYLLVAPFVVWVIARAILNWWQPDEASADRARSMIAGGIAGAAILKAGEHIKASNLSTGDDLGRAFFFGLVACGAIAIAMERHAPGDSSGEVS
jgi:hypothetical protein